MAVKLLAIHYLLWFGAVGGVLQYVSVFGKEHTKEGATNIGILMAVLPFVVLVAKPLFCAVADHFHAHKLVLVLMLISVLIGYGLMATVPFIDNSSNWYLFCLFVLIANSAMGVVTSLSDSFAMKDVVRKQVTYGSMRVFGTIGWGLFGLLSGVVNDKRYLPLDLPLFVNSVIFIFGTLIVIDILFIVFKFKANKPTTDTSTEINLKTVDNSVSETEFKQTSKHRISVKREVFNAFSRHPSLFQHSLIAIIVGTLTAFHWTYFYWFIQDLNGKEDTLLLGLCTVVQCFVGELPFFLLAEWIVKKIGTPMSLNISLLAFAARYFGYAYFINKETTYYVLIFETLQGPTFGLFYCVITKIAQEYAMKASANNQSDANQSRNYATMQGIMSGCFEGAGLGFGALLGGLIIDNWTINGIWVTGIVLAVTSIVFNVIVELIKSMRKSAK